MSYAVNFDCKLVLEAEGVKDEAAVRMLPAELEAREAPVAQGVPQFVFRGRWLAALVAGGFNDLGRCPAAPFLSQRWPSV